MERTGKAELKAISYRASLRFILALGACICGWSKARFKLGRIVSHFASDASPY